MDGRSTQSFPRKLFGGPRWGKAFGVSVILGAAFFAGQGARGQAMGKLTLDGSAPPGSPVTVESNKNAAAKAAPAPSAGNTALPGGGGIANNVKPAAIAPATRLGAIAPEVKPGELRTPLLDLSETRTVAPLPDIKPLELPKPPASAPAVRTGGTFLDISPTDFSAPLVSMQVTRTAPPPPVAAPVEAPKPATSMPAASVSAAPAHPAASAPATDVKPATDIEKTPIRRDTPEEKVPAANSSTGGALSGWGGTGQVIAALAIVLGLIFVGRALVRKFVPGAGASSGKGVIEVLARHPLSKNQALVLVRIGSQIVAINQGRDVSQSVLVITEPMEVARIIGQIEGKSPTSIQAGFNKLLANARMDLESGENEVETKSMGDEDLDEQLEEMAAAKRQLMELRQHVRSVRDSLPREG